MAFYEVKVRRSQHRFFVENNRHLEIAEACAPRDASADPVTGCIAGTPPSCSDGLSCTDDACDATADACVNTATCPHKPRRG